MSTELLSIQPLSLIPHQSIPFEVMVWDDDLNRPVRLIDKEERLSSGQFENLISKPGQRCYVRPEARSAFQDYVRSHISPTQMTSLAPIQRQAMSVEYLRLALLDALSKISLNIWIETAFDLAELVINSEIQIDCGREIMVTLPDDSSFLSHCLNTGVYSYLLAKRLGLNSECVRDAMAGGFLHDTGKLEQPNEDSDRVWAPDGLLPANSIKESPGHMTQGLLRLSWHPRMTQATLLSVYQHHERIDGRGSPVGLVGTELSIVSRICAVANRWDGLLSDRRGRKGATRIAAAGVLESESGSYWDREVVTCLIEIMKQTSIR